jgi:hypothetical protein
MALIELNAGQAPDSGTVIDHVAAATIRFVEACGAEQLGEAVHEPAGG